ncbi:Hypothetical predicted protein [Pelobates cultripes]|uniref:Uncharacterized protein n=1 Tax=Pelobates cultripes TaxID=61616 RepID=A0AAD1T8L3_PELCU|nr:Hypothetical predicted protein [Pelobates cultripes]
MCLKYSLQEIPETNLCDCMIRRREEVMSYAHHTYLINCQTGTCICLSEDPGQTATHNYPSTQQSKALLLRGLLRGCLTGPGKKQTIPKLSAENDVAKHKRTSASTATYTNCQHLASETSQEKPRVWTQLSKHVRENLKSCFRGLSCCVPAQRE